MYHINFGIWSGIFAVPNEVVDHHVKLCGQAALQVLLLLLRNGRPMEAEELAQELTLTLSDIQDALSYWVKAGVIVDGRVSAPDGTTALMTEEKPVAKTPQQPERAASAASETLAEKPEKTEKPQPSKTVQQPETPTRKVRVERFASMTRQDVLEVSQRDEMVRHLLEGAQDVLGRILSNRETESIVALYYNYQMSPDIILMLLQYCKSIGKDSIAYIERLGAQWVEREINTHERAEQELLRLTNEDEQEKELREIFGIYQRGVTKRELEYYTTWKQELDMPRNMIALAHERTIDNHGKLNFAYTNAILTDWHRKGITSVEQAQREQRPDSGKGQSGQGGQGGKGGKSGNASYDMDKVEEMLDYGSVWD